MQKVRRIIVPVLALAPASAPAAAQRNAHRAPADPPTTVILVRHAEKVTSNPLDRDPDLTPVGRQRAQDLAALLRGRHIDAIITTQLKRTRETAQPLADALHLTPETVEMNGRGDLTARAIADLIRTRHAGQTVLVVAHTDVVPYTIQALGGPRMGWICEQRYGEIFTMTLPRRGAPALAHDHYGAAEGRGGDECVNGIDVKHKHHGL